ncbi:transcriptional regulator [Colwellia sp. 75C3]|uniref:winged helix-turn-helix domain-containing protein n=1 Tax=Colwellia sp. 75C3 TaxID=888425 RepID=UPI000C31E87B|nr:winged helix-turn-helix domain-containing protein [Colwellia sp. 75C3]PKG86218.1 transcriptional regulator [Colwellia sp. 75C3]
MAVKYWVGDFFVDLSRNQVTQKQQSQTIAPKALAVLTYLAENQGKVVSYDELFTKVWPDTVVTPNTLQRSIAQLRKVLGEDSQYQSYIKTHTKQGYSLECEVRWQDKIDAQLLFEQELLLKSDKIEPKITQDNSFPHIPIESPHIESSRSESSGIESTSIRDSDAENKPQSALSWLTLIASIILAIISTIYFIQPQPFKLSVGELRSVTATDNKEFGGIYSPDGEYIVFLRYSEKLCVDSNLWAKHTKTQKEIQLTKNMARYGTPSFSKDGKKLVFIKTENCSQPVTQKQCYKLMTLDFEQALKTAQSPNLLMACKNSRIRKPTWLNNNNVALLQKISNRWKLASYSIVDNKSTVIYSLEDGNLIDYDYSVKDDLIALTSIHNDGLNYIETLKPNGEIISSHLIEYPPEIAKFRFLYPNFTPMNEQLIFSTGRQLFGLSYQGKITNISLPLDAPMGSPIFHPDGKRMLVIKGNWDSDIATISLSRITKTQADQFITREDENYSIIARSNIAEYDAQYQPNGDLIAFKSDRSGEDQLWITDGNSPLQLTHFLIDSRIDGHDWAVDGKSILVNANNVLTQVALASTQNSKQDSTEESFPFDHSIEQLFHWNSEDNTALITARIKGILTFGEFNLNNSEFRVITDKKVNWALKSEDGRLIYTDQMDRFWQPGPAEDQLIESLEHQGSDQRFITKNNVLYGINEQFQLWSYDLNGNTFKILGNTPINVDYLTDTNQVDILLSIRISAKKEVAELYLKD